MALPFLVKMVFFFIQALLCNAKEFLSMHFLELIVPCICYVVNVNLLNLWSMTRLTVAVPPGTVPLVDQEYLIHHSFLRLNLLSLLFGHF